MDMLRAANGQVTNKTENLIGTDILAVLLETTLQNTAMTVGRIEDFTNLSSASYIHNLPPFKAERLCIRKSLFIESSGNSGCLKTVSRNVYLEQTRTLFHQGRGRL